MNTVSGRGGQKNWKNQTELLNWTKKSWTITNSFETELIQFSLVRNNSIRFKTVRFSLEQFSSVWNTLVQFSYIKFSKQFNLVRFSFHLKPNHTHLYSQVSSQYHQTNPSGFKNTFMLCLVLSSCVEINKWKRCRKI